MQQSCASPSSYLGLNYSPKAEPKCMFVIFFPEAHLWEKRIALLATWCFEFTPSQTYAHTFLL